MASAEEKERLVKCRGTCKAQMTSFRKYVETIEPKISLIDAELCELQDRLNKIESVYEKFEGLQDEIELHASDIESQLSERSKFDDVYFSLKAKAKTLIKKFSPVQNEVASVSSRQESSSGGLGGVKLPVITLPKFSGDYKTWLEFRDIFSSLIHDNESLSPIQKFHYLRSSLQDAAAQVIRSLDFAGANYSIAWRTLCDRYNNNRLLVHMHLKSLFDLEPIERESAEKLRFLIDSVSKNLNALTALKQETQHWGTLIMYLVSTKLDSVTDREWEEFKCTKPEILSWSDLREFLKSRADLLDTLERRNVQEKRDKPQMRQDKKNKGNTRGLVTNEIKCVSCKGEHQITGCEEFLKLSINNRVERIRQLRLCLNCLEGGHYSRYCRTGPCTKCKAKHSILLHSDIAKSNDNSLSTLSSSECNTGQVALSASNSDNHVFLSTVLLAVQDKKGEWRTVRALLDSGSQSNFVTLELCDRLGLRKESFNLIVGGLGQNASNINYRCEMRVQSLHNAFNASLNCLVLPEITGHIPSVRIDVSKIEIPKNIVLADPLFYKPGQIDILIGNELFYRLLCIGQINLGPHNPTLQKTRFGWVVSGSMQNRNASKTICNLSANVSGPEDDFDLQKFWDVEHELANEKNPWSNEENECEPHFQNTFRRDTDGRFIVSMQGVLASLGESKDKSWRRFLSLQRRFDSNPEFKRKCHEFMNEYRELGHMSEVSYVNENEFAYYMPHHGVMKEDSLTTKLRVVFDCSMQTSSGRSLNDLQMVGPVIQPDLISILFRFREFRYVISADIAKMYRQVLIEPRQRPLQRIFWRESPAENVKVFNLNTVTYGQSSASILAVRRVLQLAKECKDRYPDISKIIETSFYVDDFLCSVNSIERGIYICEAVSEGLVSGNIFGVVSVDYMGPLMIKDKRGRGARLSKCYINVFVCFVTKALHLEVVADLTSEAFLLAFRRFVGRRGKPSHVYSDNESIFVGANRELRELGCFLRENRDNLSELYSQENVQWHFIPAHSPHFGGLWEAGVKSAKHHLKRVTGSANLTFEELSTLLAQIEAILNSRPLTPLSSDPNDYCPLTPAHFLIGKSLAGLPDPDVRHIPESRLSVYQRIQQMKQHFWSRWHKEYVSELQQRVKWKQTQSEVQPGSLVLIKEDNTPPLRWRLGRVVLVHPGGDKINRVADIKTAADVQRSRSRHEVITGPSRSSKFESGLNAISAEPDGGKIPERLFLSPNYTTVQAQMGTTAVLHCEVLDLGESTVSWIRKRDYHLLTVGLQTYSSDKRFFTSNAKNGQDWALHIRYAQLKDAGLYECQVTTHPASSLFVELELVEAHADIVGGTEKIVKSGSPLRLSCILRRSTEPPEYIFWYRGERMINYDLKGGAAVRHGRQGSELLIPRAEMKDAGNYSCVPSNARPANVTVHVLQSEKPAAMQHDSKGGSAVPYVARHVSNLLLLGFLTFLLRR